jgi:small GTP-binding protein
MSSQNNITQIDYLFKYIIIGDAGVGKSNILLRYVYSTFKSDYQLTIGVEFGEKTVEIKGKIYKIQIWDTAGNEQFRSITRTYYKNSVCAIVVYDISRRETFDNVINWIEDCKLNSPKSVFIILVGNKSDLEEDRQVTTEEGEEFANRYGIRFFETSAKNSININEIFSESVEFIADRIEKKYYDLDNETCGIKKKYNSKISLNSKKTQKKKECC